MSKLQGNEVSNVSKWEDLRRYTSINFGRILSIVNGSLSFGDNLQGTSPIDFKITAASQIVQISFSLPYVPSNFIVCFKDGVSDIYVPNVNQYIWTQNAAFITATAAVSGRIIIF